MTIDSPTVWMNLTQQQLDDAYDQSIYSPNRQQVLSRYHHNSERTRQRLGQPQQFRYGQGQKETLDIFSPAQSDAPICIFIHGGAWQSGAAAQYAFLADLFVDAGVHLVLPDFDWVQDCDGNLLTIADQVRRAIAWTGQNTQQLSADPQRIFLCGHSSGAHLAATALSTLWQTDFDLPADLIKGAVLCSGMYDLVPVSLSARSSYVNFTEQCVQQLSPQRYIDQIQVPLVIAYGDLETPEFQRQSQSFYDDATACNSNAELIIAHEYNHFEILETLTNPRGLLGEAALGLITSHIS